MNDDVNNKKNNNSLVIILVFLIVFIVVITCYKFLIFDKGNNKTSNTSDTVLENNKKDDNVHYVEDGFYEKLDDINKNEEKTIDEKKYKTIDIYYEEYDSGQVVYFCNDVYNSKKKTSSFTCTKEDCECISISKDHIIVKENNQYNLYNYTKNQLLISDFANGYAFNDEDTSNDKLSIAPSLEVDNKGNAVSAIYVKDNISKIYSLYTNKTYSNVKGYVDIGFGSVNYIKFKDNNLLYLIDYSTDYEKRKTFLFDLKTGKTVFDNIKVDYTGDDYFVTYTDKSFSVYDYKINKLYESKEYTSFLKSGKDFALVVENTNLNLYDLKGNLLTTFITDYYKDKYNVHTMISGWYEQNGKNGIYIVVGEKGVTVEDILRDNSNITEEDARAGLTEGPSGDYNGGYEYYYIPSTKETGKIATYIGGYAKPILYLYPTKTTDITVTFEHPEYLTTTYPKFINNWKVKATKDGNLTDLNGRNYYALYWEEIKNHEVDFSEGFYVEKKDAIRFLEEKLNVIGLNEMESNEFIMYWLPILEKNEKNLIYFELTEERDSYNKLIINPKPDSILRIAMHVKKVDNKIKIRPQELIKFNRTGFSAVEWGGVIY